jgi:hypothetical protein
LFGVLDFIGITIDEDNTMTYITIKKSVTKYLNKEFDNMKTLLSKEEIIANINKDMINIEHDDRLTKLYSCHSAETESDCVSSCGKHFIPFQRFMGGPKGYGYHYCEWDKDNGECKSRKK